MQLLPNSYTHDPEDMGMPFIHYKMHSFSALTLEAAMQANVFFRKASGGVV